MSKTFAKEKSLTRIGSSSSTLRGVHQTSGSASQTRNAVDAAVVSGSSAVCARSTTPLGKRSRVRRCRSGIVLLRSRGGERLDLGRLRSCPVRVLLGDVGLVVDALDVDGPDVVLCAGDQVVHGANRREHRVIGVVVAVQAVASDLLQVLDPVE